MKSDRAMAVCITKEYPWKKVQNLRALSRIVNREVDLEGHNQVAGFSYEKVRSVIFFVRPFATHQVLKIVRSDLD
jgi:hypothetical protein